MNEFLPDLYFYPVNDNINPSNVDRTFSERQRVKKLQQEVNNMLEDIESAARLNGFFSPLVGESGYYELSFDDIIYTNNSDSLQNDYFLNLFSPERPKPRIISINENPTSSPLKAKLEIIKND
jgi:hypothetical protein